MIATLVKELEPQIIVNHGPVEPRTHQDLAPAREPSEAAIRAIIDEWVVPTLLQEFLNSRIELPSLSRRSGAKIKT